MNTHLRWTKDISYTVEIITEKSLLIHLFRFKKNSIKMYTNNILQLKVRFLYKISNNITIPGLGPSYDTSIDVLKLRQILQHDIS
jgi:hypothetical protein